MKKLFFSLVVVMMAATTTYAQNTLVATLSHGEDITMYYGSYGFRDAVNAAQSGDVINLSGGAFQAVSINKAITLRGTGIDDTAPTFITGDFDINIPSEDTNRLSMEGVRCTGTIKMKGAFNSPYFVKSQFYEFYYYNSPTIKNVLFVNCKITYQYNLRGSSSVQFINSYVNGFANNSETTAAASFINCVILPPKSGYAPEYICSSHLLNCIVYQNFSGNYNLSSCLPTNTIATNCVAIGYNDLFGYQPASTGNYQLNQDQFSQLFKDFTGSYSESQTFELTEDAATNYLGTDGTQVGLYGGVLPYSSTPSYPQITKMNVANKTTADGKLSVEIEVSAAE